jgi:hypothetical protein
MYSKKDIELFTENIEQIKNEIQIDMDDKVIPTLKDRKDILNIIKNYVIKHKLKIYGGNAQNLAIKKVEPEKVFYTNERDIHDLDIYSTKPIKDIIKICDLIYHKGFKNIRCVEAIHIETYSIKLDKYTFCDLTYVPKALFHKIPFSEVDGFSIVRPYFTYIDFLRMFVDPYSSSFRWDKHFERFNKIQEIFPFKKYTEPLNLKKIELEKQMDKNIHKIIRKFAKTSKTLIKTGFESYNKYCKINKDILPNYIQKLPLQYIEFVSSNYEKDVVSFMENLKMKLSKNKECEIGCIEKYKFFQFLDFSTEIFVNGILIAKIYGNNNICIPYILINNRKYATFQFNLMWFLIKNFYSRVYGSDNIEFEYKKIISHLLTMRMDYLNKYKLNFLDKSIYQDFIAQCSGIPINIQDIKTKNKKYHGFKYEPIKNKKINVSKFVFGISDGTYISDNKNCKINID